MSFDTVQENAAFAAKYEFPYSLLCDTERSLGIAYGACSSKIDPYPNRITYVVGPDGTVEQAIETGDPAAQAAEILASLG